MEEGWGPPTVLREMLLAATGSENANQMLHRFYTDEWPRSRVATLARLVDAAAVESDAVALGDSARRGAAIWRCWPGRSARSCGRQGRRWRSPTSAECSRAGLLLESFRTLVELQDGVRCGAPRRGPAEGALREAYRSAGLDRIERAVGSYCLVSTEDAWLAAFAYTGAAAVTYDKGASVKNAVISVVLSSARAKALSVMPNVVVEVGGVCGATPQARRPGARFSGTMR